MKNCPICNEILGDNVVKCFNCNFVFGDSQALKQAEEAKKLTETQKRNERLAQIQKERELDAEIYKKQQEGKEKILAINDLFEYDFVSVVDSKSGGVDLSKLKEEVANHANKGWRLVFSFSNEMGHNSHSLGYGGISAGTNATIDQNILIFERCVSRYSRKDI